jgi:hypothetical protein
MYWYKKPYHSILGLGLCCVILNGCQPSANSSASSVKYFDLKKYFTDEAARLTKKNAPIFKTVIYNGEPESKNILIKNWQRELDLFIGSGINKPAWKDSYRVAQNNDSIVYNAIDTNLHTRHIAIRLNANKVIAISISNITKNMLYKTSEKLIYYPDSAYVIEKKQAVKLLGANTYQITGKFK